MLRSFLITTPLVVLFAAPLNAAEPEAVRFEIDASAATTTCVDEAAFREDVRSLGGSFRDANLEDRARTLRIEIASTPTNTKKTIGRLIVRDLVFRERAREVTKATCAEVAHALALFVATALDEAPPPLPVRRATAQSSSTTLTAASAAATEEKPEEWRNEQVEVQPRPRLGSGGLVASAYAAGLTSSTSAEGLRVHVAIRVGEGGTRLGIGLAAAQEHRDTRLGVGPEKGFSDVSNGSSKRAGVFMGWGAPWNDRVVGFGAEAGVLGASHVGSSAPILEGSSDMCRFGVFDPSCFGARSPASWSYISPYVTSQIVFQFPIKKFPVRPIASIGALWVVSGPHDRGYSAMTTDLGVVWQAW